MFKQATLFAFTAQEFKNLLHPADLKISGLTVRSADLCQIIKRQVVVLTLVTTFHRSPLRRDFFWNPAL